MRPPIRAIPVLTRRRLCALGFAAALAPSFPSRASDAHFGDWPSAAMPADLGKRLARRFLQSPHMLWEEHGTLHYAEVATWYGALTLAQLTRDAELVSELVRRFDALVSREERLIPPATHVDHTVFGALPLQLYLQTGLTKYRTQGLAFADAQWDNPTPEGLTNQTRFWIDDMYMITLVQMQAWRATGDATYLNRTADQMLVYLGRLQQRNGLFHHAADVPFFWGRGNGWMAAGMTELLRSMPESHPRRAALLAAFRQMMAALLQHQAPQGMWRQLVDHPESWPETSATGMFTFAFITGVKHGWLDAASYGPAARKAWLALTGYVNPNGDVREVCVGTGAKNDLQYYLDRPRSVGDFHGQAPLLWSASALLR